MGYPQGSEARPTTMWALPETSPLAFPSPDYWRGVDAGSRRGEVN